MKLRCRSTNGFKRWVHGVGDFLPAEFADLEVTPEQAEFLRGYSGCEVASDEVITPGRLPPPPPLPGLPKPEPKPKRSKKRRRDS